MSPPKLNMKGMPDAYDEGAIIATEKAAVVSFEELVEDLGSQRVIYVGETHTSQEDHKIQLEVIQALFKKFPDRPP